MDTIPSDTIIISAYEQIKEWASKKYYSTTDLTPQKSLWKIYRNESPALLEGQSILDTVYKLTASYYLFGKKYIATKLDALKLVDYGK